MSEQNKALIRRLYEDHWNRKNPSLANELFAPSASLRTPDGELTGTTGASLLLEAYTTAFPDFHLAIEDVIAEGDKVVVRYAFTGTHRGALAGIPASGKRVSVTDGIAIFRVVAGKVTEMRAAWDKYGLLQQVGALASSAAGPQAV